MHRIFTEQACRVRSLRLGAIAVIQAIGLVLLGVPAQAQLVLNQTQSPNNLVQNVLIGPGIEVDSITFNNSLGNLVPPLFTTYGQMGRFNGSNTSIGLSGGVFLCTNNAQTHLPGPNNVLMQNGGGYDPPGFTITPDLDLSQLSGWQQWDSTGGNNIGNKSILEFNFVPTGDMVSLRYVFSSEEYERWTCTQYNDAFGFFLSGPGISGPYTNNALNIAYIPGSMSSVSINTVNSGRMDANNANGPWTDPFRPCLDANPSWQADSIYYRYNGGQWPYSQPLPGAAQQEAPYNTDPYYIQHNGMTVVLTASAAVECGQMYHAKLGLGNVADNKFPSAVWLEEGSFASSDRFSVTVDAGPNVDLSGSTPVLYRSSTDSVYLRFNRWGGFYLDENLQISVGGDAVAGVDYIMDLTDSLHINQLDSAVVIPIVVPVHAGGPRELVIDLVTCDGAQVRSFPLTLTANIHTSAGGATESASSLVLFPNPASSVLHVALPSALQGAAELQMLDVTGRVVLQQAFAGSGVVALDQLTNGLYTVKVTSGGSVATSRVRVVH